LSLFFCLQKQSEVKAMASSGVVATPCIWHPVAEEKLKSSVMIGSALDQSPQLGSSMAAKELWLLLHHLDLRKPV
jgi:hypothetical protein